VRPNIHAEMQFCYDRGVCSGGCAQRHNDGGEELRLRSLKGGDHTRVKIMHEQGLYAIVMVGTGDNARREGDGIGWRSCASRGSMQH